MADYAIHDSYSSATTAWQNITWVPVVMDVVGWSATVTFYKMRGMDKNTSGVYATWIVAGSPDWLATRYAGGLTTPLRDVCVIDSWSA